MDETRKGEWVVVENNRNKRFPDKATPLYVAKVNDLDRFERELLKTGRYAYKLSSYKRYFQDRLPVMVSK